MTAEFLGITEDWTTLANREQASMAATRYQWVRNAISPGELLLDVAAGTAYGLRHIDRANVIAGDLMLGNLLRARQRGYEGPLVRLDAQRLPFRSETVDAVCCLEALYYLPDQPRFFAEVARVLRPGGRLLISMPNRHRPTFEPSRASTHYPDASELLTMASGAGLAGEVLGAFSWEGDEPSWRRALRRVIVQLHLMPRSMRAKSLLKRVVYRRMQPLSVALLTAPVTPMHVTSDDRAEPWTMLYLSARKPDS